MNTSTYTVKSGDTLSIIAEKKLGSASKWRLLADINNLSNPNNLRMGQKLQIPSEFSESPNVVNTGKGINPPTKEQIQVFTEDKTVYAKIESEENWFRIGKLFRKGLFRNGTQEPEKFITDNAQALEGLNLSQSDINVILATSENEGNLDAVNTWDNQFISFGMFQWTAGGKNAAGELAALLARIKENNPDDFHHYWGQFGLDIANTNLKTGWITLDGQILKSEQQKSVLREPIWAYRFAQAGTDEQIKALEIAHAVGRINQFYFTSTTKLKGHKLSELITSELGVALLLDNHVNRPAYVFPCVASAIESCGLQPADMVQGNSDQERQVIEKYLKIRESYGRSPMTNAQHRGKVTQKYVQKGIISDDRDSFKSNQM